MLVITRKLGESVEIITPQGEKIYVVITSVKGLQARLGFVCRREIEINREHDYAHPGAAFPRPRDPALPPADQSV